ncbi:MAG: hypothetical protein JXB34_04590 [Bacteroidales bacterium]|nr:hypothetical protein [Bacteroidales bacterium]
MKAFAFILIVLHGYILFGQGEIDDQQTLFYRNERTFSFLLNSNGVGVGYRYAKRIDAFRKTLVEAEINYLKHPKEYRVLTAYERRIVYGKLNSVIVLKGAIGYQKELFQKRDLGGISIRSFYNLGPALAIQKPIYYQYSDNKGGYYTDEFKSHLSPYDFIGKAPLSEGLDKTSLSPGIYGKYGFSFEYSRIDQVYHALELGLAFDAYFRELKIMDTKPGKVFFILPDNYFVLTLFISYRFGKVIDAQYSNRSNRVEDILQP